MIYNLISLSPFLEGYGLGFFLEVQKKKTMERKPSKKEGAPDT